MEGSSKAQIVTPRSVTPTSEIANKKKKMDNEMTSKQPTSKQPIPPPAFSASSKAKGESKQLKDSSPPSKPMQSINTGI